MCEQRDLSMVSTVSRFSESVFNLFSRLRPTKILETGTYHGTGTTSIIAASLRDLRIDDAVFYSIEVNPGNHAKARENLTRSGLIGRVRLLNGLSVPRRLLPTRQEIEEQCVRKVEHIRIYADHLPEERAERYFSETDWPEVRDDVLGRCLEEFEHSPDFVLLDSAGSMGNIEFNYVIERLKAPCHIALDDIHHVKHHKSLLQIKKDPRFQILEYSDERTGFCIVRFDPLQKDRAADLEKLVTTGERLFAQGDLAEAIGCFEKVLKQDPSHSMALNDLGVIAFQSGDLPSAEALLTRAVRLDRRHMEALANLAAVHTGKGEDARAAELLAYAETVRKEASPGTAEGAGRQGSSQTAPQGIPLREFAAPFLPLFDKLRIVCAGPVHPQNGPQVLLEALLRLDRKGMDFSCSFAGGWLDEAFVTRLKKGVEEWGMESRISFLGRLDRRGLKKLYATHNLLVSPPLVNGSPGLRTGEAMAAGLAVISSDEGDREIIEDGVSGLFFDPGDHERLTQRLMGLVRDPSRWEALARNGQRRAIE